MSEFTLLFRSRSTQRDQRARQKWAAWIMDLDARGLIASPGQPLQSAGRLVEGHGQGLQTTSLVEFQNIINGFIVLAAQDLDEAVEISMGCPIFEEGGSIEVRPVLQINS